MALTDPEILAEINELRILFITYLAEQLPDLDRGTRDRAYFEVMRDSEDLDEIYNNLTTSLLEFGLDPVDFIDRFMVERGFATKVNTPKQEDS